MESILRIGLSVSFILYFGIVFILRSIVVGKKISKNPIVFPKDKSADAFIGSYFKFTVIGVFIYVCLFSIFPNKNPKLNPTESFIESLSNKEYPAPIKVLFIPPLPLNK